MVIAFSLSWVWSVLYNLLRDYECLPPLVTRQEFFFGILTHCIAMSSTVWNPILYALLNLQLRAAFIQLIPECIKRVLIELCGRKKNQQQQKQRTSAAEKSRLLGIQPGGRESGGGTKKVLICFLSSRGSVELSTSSDSRHNVSAEPRTTPATVEKALKLKTVQHQKVKGMGKLSERTFQFGKNGATLPLELADSSLGSRAETETTMASGVVETKQRLRLVQCGEDDDQQREEAEATADGIDIKELDTDEHI
uniref:G_PROTEIN_RECEP_F1_2 domain-containing protein n=1 Tax=Globodera pallida TaxID=36090 RepID=A0A183BM66_GLOPA